jgi:hypothetical protein
MHASPQDLAQVRLDNALALFEEFVRATARHADAATLRGLERRFAERIQIQPSYWSQIKGRSRQIGERLARQFEMLCQKPPGWMDAAHGSVAPAAAGAATVGAAAGPANPEWTPRDEDERFILGLVLTYYRRHPQRARQRLLDLLGEVLTSASTAATAAVPMPMSSPPSPPSPVPLPPGVTRPPPRTPSPAQVDDPRDLWLRSQSGVAPLKRKR